MSFDPREPLLRPKGDDTYELVEELVYTGKRDTFTIPKGFLTDGASVPRAFTALFPKLGRYTRAAIVHDWFCKLMLLGLSPVSARDADGIFRRIMRELGVSFRRRWLMWAAVRWGALGNPVRRKGWLKDAPLVLLITVLALPLALVAGVVNGVLLLVLGHDRAPGVQL